MPIHMACPSCGKTLAAPDAAAGKRAKCPGCAQVLTVPAPVQQAEVIGAAAPVAGSEQTDYGIAEPTPAPVSPASVAEQRQPCPDCGEMIIVGAAKCRFCGAIFDPNLKQISRGGSAQLRHIAREQRNMLSCLAGYLGGSFFVGFINGMAGAQARPGQVPGTSPFVAGVSLVVLVAFIAAVVFTVRLAAKLYSTGATIFFGIWSAIPCLGLISMLIVNSKATKRLNEHGIKVGFFGANMSQFGD